jgi:hypothetical protein
METSLSAFVSAQRMIRSSTQQQPFKFAGGVVNVVARVQNLPGKTYSDVHEGVVRARTRVLLVPVLHCIAYANTAESVQSPLLRDIRRYDRHVGGRLGH